MVVQGDLGLDAFVWTLVGLFAGSLAVAAIIAVVCAHLDRERLGCASLVMAWALTVALGVVAVVLWRTKDGEATRFDWLWAIGLGALGWTIARRLWRRQPRATVE